MSFRVRRIVMVWFVVTLTGAFVAQAMPGDSVTALVDEVRQLALRVAERRQALDPDVQAISPDKGRFSLDLQEALERLAGSRNELMERVSADLATGRTGAVEELAVAVAAVPADCPSRRTLRTLAAGAAAKVRLADGRNVAAPARARLLALLDGRGGPRPRTGVRRRSRPGKGVVPIYVAFHWHMHQPIYWPYEDIVTTERRGAYSYSLYEIFDSRSGPYTRWPFDAVALADREQIPAGGAQVSFSGSLIENLNDLRRVRPHFEGWWQTYQEGRRMRTGSGNPRLDLVAFGYHHPLMALVGYEDIRRQIAAHRAIVQQVFGADVPYSKGIFPPENAFAATMIPALVDEGLEWVFVDNIHFSRACQGYPWVRGENLVPPNPADQRNPDPGQWTQLNGLWAPSKVTPFANRPHWVVAVDPATGRTERTPEGRPARMVAVPTDRYMGNEDGRGGFGALNYETVLSQLEFANTDPAHPLLVVLHHDGDNYGGGTHAYYHENCGRFVAWVKANPERFVWTTVQDYLDRFPPADDDVIHVEPGSWSGADNGDAEFHKWNGDPDPTTGYSPDRNSWGVMTATRNVLAQARAAGLDSGLLQRAERFLAVAQTSCYEYWDGTEMWDSHPTRACNQAVEPLLPLIRTVASDGRDAVGPALYAPQREPYNPGGFEWGTEPETCDCTVWTYAYDVGGLAAVTLRWRVEPRRRHPGPAHLRDRGGRWFEQPMQARTIPAQTNPLPLVKADEYGATITGVEDALVSYQVVARDGAGNETRSPLLHVYVGPGVAQPTGPVFEPAEPTAASAITVWSDRPGALHWGVEGWTQPIAAYWPQGTTAWPDGKAVETTMTLDEATGRYGTVVGPFRHPDQAVTQVQAVFHFADGSWGKDFTIPVHDGAGR